MANTISMIPSNENINEREILKASFNMLQATNISAEFNMMTIEVAAILNSSYCGIIRPHTKLNRSNSPAITIFNVFITQVE